MYDDKSLITDNLIKYINKDTYFQNVHLFVKWIQDMTVIKNDELL